MDKDQLLSDKNDKKDCPYLKKNKKIIFSSCNKNIQKESKDFPQRPLCNVYDQKMNTTHNLAYSCL